MTWRNCVHLDVFTCLVKVWMFQACPLSIQVCSLSIQVYSLSIQVCPLSIPVYPLSIQVCSLSIQVYSLFIQVYPLSIQVYPLSIQVYPLSIQVCPLSFQTCPWIVDYEMTHLEEILDYDLTYDPKYLCTFTHTCSYLIGIQGLNVSGLRTVHACLSSVFPDMSTVHPLLPMKWPIQKRFLIMTLHSDYLILISSWQLFHNI